MYKYIIILSFLFFAVPLFIPVDPLAGTVDEKVLADEDSLFLSVGDIDVHYKMKQGDPKRNFILLHGFGSNLWTWEKISKPLSKLGTVVSYDRPAFGLTSRPLSFVEKDPYSYEYQSEIFFQLMDRLKMEKTFIVANSAGADIAVRAYFTAPSRIDGIILIAPSLGDNNSSFSFFSKLAEVPQYERLGPLISRSLKDSGESIIKSAWYDPSRISEKDLEGYRKNILINNWDTALWSFTKASFYRTSAGRVEDIRCPVLVLSGDSDVIIPVDKSRELARRIQNSSFRVIEKCGHLPQEERPDELMAVIIEFIASLDSD
jgi:pimeloyl-ACP methyl ester carboxylesterase